MNPARTLGSNIIFASALTSEQQGHLWLYWLGPILGGITAAIVYQMLFQAEDSSAESKKGEYELAQVEAKDKA